MDKMCAAVKAYLHHKLFFGPGQRNLLGDLKESACKAYGKIIAYGALMLKAEDSGQINFAYRAMPIDRIGGCFGKLFI